MQKLVGANGFSPPVASLSNVANDSGSGAGNPVTVSSLASFFEDQFGNGLLPPAYSVQVTPSQACAASVMSKTSTGFSVTLTPDSTVTLSAGTFDVLVFGGA
jgi:hypothetical protein